MISATFQPARGFSLSEIPPSGMREVPDAPVGVQIRRSWLCTLSSCRGPLLAEKCHACMDEKLPNFGLQPAGAGPLKLCHFFPPPLISSATFSGTGSYLPNSMLKFARPLDNDRRVAM